MEGVIAETVRCSWHGAVHAMHTRGGPKCAVCVALLAEGPARPVLEDPPRELVRRGPDGVLRVDPKATDAKRGGAR